MNKKGQGYSINVVIIIAIALIVLVVLIAIFTGRLSNFVESDVQDIRVEVQVVTALDNLKDLGFESECFEEKVVKEYKTTTMLERCKKEFCESTPFDCYYGNFIINGHYVCTDFDRCVDFCMDVDRPKPYIVSWNETVCIKEILVRKI